MEPNTKRPMDAFETTGGCDQRTKRVRRGLDDSQQKITTFFQTRKRTDGPQPANEQTDDGQLGDEQPDDEQPDEEPIALPGQPLVWADKRQSLCAALPYFKSYQGGLYTGDGIVKGYLLDGETRPRDVVGAQVIVTTIGGGRTKDDSGHMVYTADQGERYHNLLRANLANKKPICVILGSNYPHHPGPQLPHRYCVLGWYHVVEVFTEKHKSNANTPVVKVGIVRLEKVNLDEPSWWCSNENAVDALASEPLAIQECKECGEACPQKFAQGWTCLNKACEDFFNFEENVNLTDLRYSAQYLGQRTQFQGDPELPSVLPPLPDTEYFQTDKDATYGTEETFRVGMACHQCGCCSSRREWTGWRCENELCLYFHQAGLVTYPLKEVIKEHKQVLQKFGKMHKRGTTTSKLDVTERFKDQCITRIDGQQYGGYYTVTYKLPNRDGQIMGTVSVLRANGDINGKPDGADELWEELESNADLGLKRNPVRHPGQPGEIITRHFARNYGAHYKFVVSVQSTDFSEAPKPVLKALMRMTWAGQQVVKDMPQVVGDGWNNKVLTDEYQDFNELLLLGYMEKDRIDYHDDGEHELGPTVATLSLGSPSVMSFCTKKSAGIQTELTGKNPCVLEFLIQHGDIIVMHGEEIHRQFKHKVEPLGKRRYAMTCRFVDPARMNNAQDKKSALEKGHIPEHVRQLYKYHGDV